MNDGWKFAEELLGITAEALKARREAEDKTKPSPGTDRYRDLRRVHHEVCDDLATRLAAILSPGTEPQEGWNLDRALDAVEKLRHWTRETEHKIRDAALEEAAKDAQRSGMRTPDEIARDIRALKSKPATETISAFAAMEALQRAGMERAAAKWERGEMDGPAPVLDPSPGRELLHADTPIRIVSANTRNTGRVIRYGDLPTGTIRHVCRLTNVQAETYVIDEKHLPASQPSGNPGEFLPCGCLGRHSETICDGTPPEPVHDFGWALARMREGKKVRCGLFPVDAVPLEMKWLTGKDDKVWARNVLATDWQVVE